MKNKRLMTTLLCFLLCLLLSGTALSETSPEAATATDENDPAQSEIIEWNPDWKYADFSEIHAGTATLYRSQAENARGIVVCVNAGHGTKGGTDKKTLCHPDGSPKVTGGTTKAGATKAVAVSYGTTFKDGTPEAAATLSLALLVKPLLLEKGFDVLMIREGDDVQLDNVARTVIANNRADCHIALHYDSTARDKGIFYCSVPSNKAYRKMEPVASHYEEHIALGDALIAAAKAKGLKVFSGGSLDIDLTQTSFSTVPSIDLEVGDTASDHSEKTQKLLAEFIAQGVEDFFAESAETEAPAETKEPAEADVSAKAVGE